jgi:hypothetical protein
LTQQVVGIDPACAHHFMRLIVDHRFTDTQTFAGVGQRLGEHCADILMRDFLGYLASLLRFADRRINGDVLQPLFDFAAASPGNEQDSPAGVQAVGKGEDALFAQRIAAIAGQHMNRSCVSRRRLPYTFKHVVMRSVLPAGISVKFVDQALCDVSPSFSMKSQ